jgi:hypothetical protein
MAQRLGLSYDDTFLKPPETDIERVMGALHCGEILLHGFTRADEWPSERGMGLGLSKRDARKAAKYLRRVLPSASGRDAVSLMAQRFGHAMAGTWREGADDPEHIASAESLTMTALASDGLARLVGLTWPVQGYEAARTKVAETKPDFDVDNPDALVNLRDYHRRSTAIAESLSVAMSERFDDFAWAILLPVMVLNLTYDVATSSSWVYAMNFWTNLLREQSVSHAEVIRQAAAEAPSP